MNHNSYTVPAELSLNMLGASWTSSVRSYQACAHHKLCRLEYIIYKSLCWCLRASCGQYRRPNIFPKAPCLPGVKRRSRELSSLLSHLKLLKQFLKEVLNVNHRGHSVCVVYIVSKQTACSCTQWARTTPHIDLFMCIYSVRCFLYSHLS